MHVLGIDAGGSKTVALLADAAGRIVGEGRSGGANLQAHGELEVEKVLHHVIDRAMAGGAGVPAAVCLGLAGVDREGDSQVIAAVMRRLGFREHTLIVNDALIALVAGVPLAEGTAAVGPGLVLISGTGSIAYGVNRHGLAARAGGWGTSLGDEGSGYWIGRRALSAVTRAADGRGPVTGLTALVLAHFTLSRPEQLVSAIYDHATGKRAIASLGPLVEQARAAGDAVAGEIMRKAAEELTLAAASVIASLEMRGEQFPVLMSGGMLRGAPWLAGEVSGRLAEVAPRSTVTALDVEPALGAVRLALAEADGGVRIPPYRDAFRATPQ
ncbi:MAG: BadF/BadG/BcrA/BcrD ATPase family protein [Acidobacteriota bacterium]|nr:BadF/BadG/BcrA/BcrD ATPase family protein [Acidobacteriota bacterium]